MPNYNLAVFLNAVEGKEKEFNEWYEVHHVPDALSLPGMKAGQRFKAGPEYMGQSAPCKYMAFYEIEAPSLDDAIAIFTDGTAKFYVSDAVDLASVHAYPLTPITEKFSSSEQARKTGKAKYGVAA
ncbi:MAG: hypothetical protein AB7E05_10990 [Sphingobium sp.]